MNIIRHFESIATRVLHSQPPSQPYSPPSSQLYCEEPKSRGGSVREIHFQINLYQPEWTRNWSRRTKQIVSLALALVLIPTALAIAQGYAFFSDVPIGHIFYDDIYAIYRARITTGTTPSTYSPEDPVLRGQMAAFLHRGLGRVAYNAGVIPSLSSNDQDVAVLTINTGGAPGGTGFLKVDAAFTAYNLGATACPCLIYFLLSADGGANSQIHAVTLYDWSEGVLSSASGAVTLAFPVPTSGPQNVRLMASIEDSAGAVPPDTIRAYGSISALWVPFGATGGNTISAASAEQGETSPEPEPDAKPDTER